MSHESHILITSLSQNDGDKQTKIYQPDSIKTQKPNLINKRLYLTSFQSLNNQFIWLLRHNID